MKPEITEIWESEIKVVTPGPTSQDAPSDVFVLCDGKNLNQEWTSETGTEPGWKIAHSCVTVEKVPELSKQNVNSMIFSFISSGDLLPK